MGKYEIVFSFDDTEEGKQELIDALTSGDVSYEEALGEEFEVRDVA